jgi:EAL domain-containing protein (putative c-di-GMP-specific phosphodiesterase class I)
MPRLDFSVMEKAMRQQRLWEDAGINTGLSINIAGQTLEQPDFDNKLVDLLTKPGAKIAFDDVGIGFTTFEYVHELPVDYMKIDPSFMRFLHERKKDQVLFKSMMEMSHSLGKEVIIEGVETREALEIVGNMGVEYIQGYYFCRPMSLSVLDLPMKLRDS